MKIIKENKKAVTIAVKALKEGKLVFMATETVYIASVDATNAKAVKKLIAFKNRPFGKPFSVGVKDITMAKDYVSLNSVAEKLYKQFLPGPVTIVSKGLHKVTPGIEAEDGTLGIRIPDYQFFIEVVSKFNKPITTTSANTAYQKRPYSLNDILGSVSQKQKGLIDLMIDAGKLPRNEPSTVIDTTTEDEPVILRQGEIKLKNKNEILSKSEEHTQNIAKELFQKYEDFAGKRAIIFALEGEMGTGKTVFVKGLAKTMGIKETVTSPSYDLENIYYASTININLIHIDTWRMLDANSEFKDLEITKLINDKSIIAIEWAERAIKEIKKYLDDTIIIWIKLKYTKNINYRSIWWGVL